MATDKLSELSMEFAVEIINLVKRLKEQRENIISNQIGRSGTYIGANIREANMLTVQLTLFQKCRLHLKKLTKQDIG